MCVERNSGRGEKRRVDLRMHDVKREEEREIYPVWFPVKLD